jgi:hypothetical protein
MHSVCKMTPEERCGLMLDGLSETHFAEASNSLFYGFVTDFVGVLRLQLFTPGTYLYGRNTSFSLQY